MVGPQLFEIRSSAGAILLGLSFLLLLILAVSFRFRPFVFCQYLFTMTGVRLKPAEVRRAFKDKGRTGVRELFLELIIKEDLQQGPLAIPEEKAGAKDGGK